VFDDLVAEPAVSLASRLQTEWTRTDALVELVRGRVQHAGPVTAEELASWLGLELSQVSSALEALEGQGVVLRGRFTAEAQGHDDSRIEWCERRLLARIHRRTIDTLRRQIQPVEPADYWRFLVGWHHLGHAAWAGPTGAREALSQLQGFEMPAGAWEHRVLAGRLPEYDPEWLDFLFLSGEAVWGRLRPPRRDADEGPSMTGMTRVMPITLALREDLPWLLPPDREPPLHAARAGAQQVLETLTARGALFFNELTRLADLLPAHLEEALRELAALGLVTSDAFAAVRKIVDGNRRGRDGRRRRRNGRAERLHGSALPVGRWSLFPGQVDVPSRETYLDRWCRQLLARYGVVFHELLSRESAAPAWSELTPTFRKLEMRGEVRGGRFVGGVGGEQYALPSAVDILRQTRDQPSQGDWLVISAADPLNLAGIITGGPRIPATNVNALALRAGQVLATLVAGEVEYLEPLDDATQWELRGALLRGGKRSHPTAPAALDRD
jgi:ATP-dependent helicase Lhr and Lhr-like helicase